jgi:ubiquitin-conjugating enzyme E2 H
MLNIGLIDVEYVQKYATKEAVDAQEDESDSDDAVSSIGSFTEDETQGLEL